MRKVMYKVPLNNLYQVMYCCLHEENADFCPVVVKIIDETILKENQNLPFLLQVWTKGGEMVFERPLQNPPTIWSISDNKLVYVEAENQKEITLAKLFKDKEAVLFKFTLPDDLTQDEVPTSHDYDSSRNLGAKNGLLDQSLVDLAPEAEPEVEYHYSKSDDFEYMRSLGEINAQNTQVDQIRCKNE